MSKIIVAFMLNNYQTSSNLFKPDPDKVVKLLDVM